MFILGADAENAVEHRAADPTPGRQFSNATADAADFLSALQGLLAALDRGHVHHLHEEPAYLAIDAVGKVTGQRIAHRATVGRRDGALELLRDATQCRLNIRQVETVALLADHFADMFAGDGRRVDTEPVAIGVVGEAVVQCAVPVTDHRRHAVEYRLQVVFVMAQFSAALFECALVELSRPI
jgi:hypothetical protein